MGICLAECFLGYLGILWSLWVIEIEKGSLPMIRTFDDHKISSCHYLLTVDRRVSGLILSKLRILIPPNPTRTETGYILISL